ncbi:hypothetical protein YC2023_100260 [Brassica napus]
MRLTFEKLNRLKRLDDIYNRYTLVAATCRGARATVMIRVQCSDPTGDRPPRVSGAREQYKNPPNLPLAEEKEDVPAPRKKGQMYGVCFISKSLASTPATFSSGTSSFGSGAKNLNNQNAQTRKLSAVCDYLATKDSTVATILQTPTMSFENF